MKYPKNTLINCSFEDCSGCLTFKQNEEDETCIDAFCNECERCAGYFAVEKDGQLI